MKKLILGATGSIGSSLAKKVIADGGEAHRGARIRQYHGPAVHS